MRMKMDEFSKELPNILENLFPSGIFRDRNRPYNGQIHTDAGERGKTEVRGLTMRDITDCFRISVWETCGSPDNAESMYSLELGDIDVLALEQNLTCNIEKMMGIYPNVPQLEYIGQDIPIIEIEDFEDHESNESA